MTMRSKKDDNQSDPEFGLDSRYSSKEEEKKEAVALMHARLERMKNVPETEILKAKLMQLKFKIENYLSSTVFENEHNFTGFLENYIDILYPKKTDFAADMNITANYLSKVINRHREPNDMFIMRLMIHSEKVYKQVCSFKKECWYQIYFKDKLSETMTKEDKWAPELEKEIKIKKFIV